MNEIATINSEIINTSWIENLALDELNMEESGIVNIDEHLNPAAFIEESSINFMNLLRDRFEIYASKFNQYRGSNQAGNQIKIFKISNTINDFMLFRNSLRLVVARKATDRIAIAFLSNGKEVYTSRLSSNDNFGESGSHEVKAHIGAFNKITWRFNGETVDADALVKHYLSEFIKNSAR